MARVLDKGMESRLPLPAPTYCVPLGELLLHLSLPLSCKMGILICALTYSPGHCHQVGSSRSRSPLAPASSSGIQDSSAKMGAILPKEGPPKRYALLWVYTHYRGDTDISSATGPGGSQRAGPGSAVCPGKGAREVRPRHPSRRSSLWPMPPVFLITDFSLAERAEGPPATWKAFPQQGPLY